VLGNIPVYQIMHCKDGPSGAEDSDLDEWECPSDTGESIACSVNPKHREFSLAACLKCRRQPQRLPILRAEIRKRPLEPGV
jgi:hypothetical protein